MGTGSVYILAEGAGPEGVADNIWVLKPGKTGGVGLVEMGLVGRP